MNDNESLAEIITCGIITLIGVGIGLTIIVGFIKLCIWIWTV